MATKDGLNLLRRPTAFTCNIRFRCDMPEPPSDPKLLIAPLQPEKLAKFAVTSLERSSKRDLLLEPGLGIHISLMDTSDFSVTDPNAQLAAEDVALLDGETDFAADTKGKKVRERLRGNKAELSWLMRTTYISNETDSRRQAVPSQRIRQIETADQSADADEAHLQAAEASFEDAQREPVHASNPSLKAVEVTPVLPDFERWGENYVLIDFDGDPTADHPRLQKLPGHKRQQLAGEAVVKSYALPGEDNKPFLAYLIPKGDDGTSPVDNDQPRAPREGEYEWAREYQFDANLRDSVANPTYLLQFEAGKCTYLDLNTRLRCSKRARSNQGSDPRNEFPRPSKITVQAVEVTEEEEQSKAARLHELRGISAEAADS